ncbi:hypothetical protein V8F06_004067 [Rhypophila decipiens]
MAAAVMRQLRRLSDRFATDDHPSTQTLQQHQRTISAGEAGSSSIETAISEGEEDMISSRRSDAALTTGFDASHHQADPSSQERQEGISQDPTAAPSWPSDQRTEPEPRPSEASLPSSLGQPAQWPTSGGSKDLTLPEDDGKGPLRRQILAIQALDMSQEVKAQLVHQLLMDGHRKSKLQQALRKAKLLPSSPKLGSSPTNHAVPVSPEPAGPLQQALKYLKPLGDGSGPLDLAVTEEDLAPTYAPATRSDQDDDPILANFGRREPEDDGKQALGCQHYRRNVKLQCAACGKWYTCRFCHDSVEDHVLPRKETKHMLCMLCGCSQRASDTCVKCNATAAQYYCGVCKLWNDDPNKPIYHCNDCGLCRVGQGLGKDFFHCKKCMACISVAGGHKCIERSIDCDCPICGEYMFSSPRPVVFMQCGHSIHRHCFTEHMQSSYKCPICNKSCINMEYQFRNYDIAIANQPMPAEYRDARAKISCNDCSAKSQTTYHWLGLKCTVCNSYNTIQHQLLNIPGGAASTVDTTTPPGPGDGQQNMAADAAWIIREIRRTQVAESSGLLTRNGSASSLPRVQDEAAMRISCPVHQMLGREKWNLPWRTRRMRRMVMMTMMNMTTRTTVQRTNVTTIQMKRTRKMTRTRLSCLGIGDGGGFKRSLNELFLSIPPSFSFLPAQPHNFFSTPSLSLSRFHL